MRSRDRSSLRGFAILAAVLATGTAGCVSIRPVEPGTLPRLGKDEGMLVVHVDTNTPIESLDFGWQRVLLDVGRGEHIVLMVVERGSYRWTALRMPNTSTSRLPGSDACRFAVEPGRINFIGTLLVVRSGFRLEKRCIDRTASGLRLLQEQYPGVVGLFAPTYSGSARHVFLDHWGRARIPQEEVPAAPESTP